MDTTESTPSAQRRAQRATVNFLQLNGERDILLWELANRSAMVYGEVVTSWLVGMEVIDQSQRNPECPRCLNADFKLLTMKIKCIRGWCRSRTKQGRQVFSRT